MNNSDFFPQKLLIFKKEHDFRFLNDLTSVSYPLPSFDSSVGVSRFGFLNYEL